MDRKIQYNENSHTFGSLVISSPLFQVCLLIDAILQCVHEAKGSDHFRRWIASLLICKERLSRSPEARDERFPYIEKFARYLAEVDHQIASIQKQRKTQKEAQVSSSSSMSCQRGRGVTPAGESGPGTLHPGGTPRHDNDFEDF
jgi:hypothetical protein